MFDVTTGSVDKRRKSRGAAFVSILLHVGVVGIVIALTARGVVEPPPEEVEITFFSQKPPPPPPPPPASSSPKKTQTKPKVEKKPDLKPQELVQPEEIPEEVAETEPEESSVEEEDGAVDGGVEGGVKGGVKGGEVGGKEGGKVGGDINSLGMGESQSLCLRKPTITYPEQAKALGIEGTVRIRILIDIDGKIVKRKEELCANFQTADSQQRRIRWHPSLCIEAVSGPEALYYETLMAWGTAKWSAWKSGNVFTRVFANVETNYRLQ